MDAPHWLYGEERGMALPMAILAVALLTSLIAGAFMIAGSERRVIDTMDAQVRAAALAQTALQQFLSERSTTFGFTASPPAAAESTRVTLTGGYADVVLERIQPAVGTRPAIYVVRSRGVLTGAALTGLPQARRTVAQYAQWQKGTMRVLGGWTSLTGLHKNGGSGSLTGNDGCGAATAVAGVAVPTPPGYTQNGGSAVPTGTPPIQNLGTAAQAAAAVKIDWDGIINRGAIVPTITIPPQSYPSSFPAGYFPVIRVNQANWGLPGPGQGTLIVTGDMSISGSNMWNGIILVGGSLTSNGNNTVEGAVVSGLNVLLGQTVPVSDVGNGNKTFQYNSCNVASALTNFSTLRAINNAWVDNWPDY